MEKHGGFGAQKNHRIATSKQCLQTFFKNVTVTLQTEVVWYYRIKKKISGYSNFFSGVCAALMILGGVFGTAASGIFLDRTKLNEETLKIALGAAVIFGLIFLQLTLHSGLSVLMAITCLLFGVLGLASYPIGLELALECTFPVSEATSTGLIVPSGQIRRALYVFTMKNFARPF